MVVKNGFSRGDVYNADETSVHWLSLPKKSLVSRYEISVPGFKLSNSSRLIVTASHTICRELEREQK